MSPLGMVSRGLASTRPLDTRCPPMACVSAARGVPAAESLGSSGAAAAAAAAPPAGARAAPASASCDSTSCSQLPVLDVRRIPTQASWAAAPAWCCMGHMAPSSTAARSLGG